MVGNLIELLFHNNLSRVSVYWYMRETQRGTLSSNSRLKTVLVMCMCIYIYIYMYIYIYIYTHT